MKHFRYLAVLLLVTCACRAAEPAKSPNPNAEVPPPSAEEGKAASLREATEWAHVWLPSADKTDLPHVLLVGDSITNAYQDRVAKALAGKAHVGYWVSSLCVADPAYELMLRSVLTQGKFAVIHFNNGLHGVGYTEAQYKDGYAKALETLRKMQPQARIVIALSTPLQEGSNKDNLNPRVVARNDAVQALAKELVLSVDDLHALMKGHPEYHSDPFHYKPQGIDIQSDAVAKVVAAQLDR
jgi:lysophospholipase L1-like esterase